MAFSLQYKGFDYVAFYNGAYENSDSLPSLAQTGANSIEATIDYGIDVATSQVVADPNYTDSLAALGNTIDQAESLGLTVMVRPLIDFLDAAVIAPYSVGDWRQNYQPTNVAAFFASLPADDPRAGAGCPAARRPDAIDRRGARPTSRSAIPVLHWTDIIKFGARRSSAAS